MVSCSPNGAGECVLGRVLINSSSYLLSIASDNIAVKPGRRARAISANAIHRLEFILGQKSARFRTDKSASPPLRKDQKQRDDSDVALSDLAPRPSSRCWQSWLEVKDATITVSTRLSVTDSSAIGDRNRRNGTLMSTRAPHAT